MASVPRHGIIDLARPGVDAAVEIDDITPAGVAQQSHYHLAAHAVVTEHDDRLRPGYIADPLREFCHWDVQRALEPADRELLGFAHVEDAVRQALTPQRG